MMLRDIFRNNVRAWRQKRGLSLEELGTSIGADGPYIAKIERTAPNVTLDTIQKIASGLGVTPVTLLSDDTVVVNSVVLADFETALRLLNGVKEQIIKRR